jgi:hypothetical protein
VGGVHLMWQSFPCTRDAVMLFWTFLWSEEEEGEGIGRRHKEHTLILKGFVHHVACGFGYLFSL